MSLWSWLGKIVSNVVRWIGEWIRIFIESVVSIIENDWDRLVRKMEDAFGYSSGILVMIKIINDIVYAVMWERGRPNKSATGRLTQAEDVPKDEIESVNKALEDNIREVA